MRLTQNVAAASLHGGVLALINLAALPWYLHYLGPEAFGLIGFYTLLQTVTQALDLGLGPTTSRETARALAAGNRQRAAAILKTLGVFYLVSALVIALSIGAAAGWIATRWLQRSALAEDVAVQSIILMGLCIAIRWPISVYHGSIAGAGRLAIYSLVSMALSTLAAVAAIAALAAGLADIRVFFAVQLAAGAVQALLLRRLAWGLVGEPGQRFDLALLGQLWKFSAWVAASSFAAMFLTQVDKLVLSRLLPLDSFGHYVIASLLLAAFQMLSAPLVNAGSPRLAALLAQGDWNALRKLYRRMTRVYVAGLVALALLLALHAETILALWFGNTALARAVAPLVVLLAIGGAMQALMNLPYSLQLAAGLPRIAFQTNLVLILVMLPLSILLASRWGAVGGALSWVVLGTLNVGLGSWLTGKRVDASAGFPWLFRDVVPSTLLVAVPSLITGWVCRAQAWPPLAELMLGLAAAAAGGILAVAVTCGPEVLLRMRDDILAGLASLLKRRTAR